MAVESQRSGIGTGLLDDDLAVLCERHGHSKPSSEAAVQPGRASSRSSSGLG